MDPKQKAQFNQMLVALREIATGYQTPDQLRKNARKQYGLDGAEAIEFAYENIQEQARQTVKGIRAIK
jgi:hypothetical protein